MTTMAEDVRFVHVVKRFGTVTALSDVSLVCPAGKITALLGPSGCGKTTTLRLAAGLERPDEGEIWIGKICVAGRAHWVEPQARGVAMVFQSYALWPHMTVWQNVMLPLRYIRSRLSKPPEDKARWALKLVRMDHMASRYPGQLSGGQQQRVALARALACEPRVLLLDEPLANLDAKLREEVRRELRELQSTLGITTIYVTHDQAEALALADVVVVMSEGVVAQQGAREDVYDRPANLFVASFVGASNLVEGRYDPTSGLLRTPGGFAFACAVPTSCRDGEVLTASFRPDRVIIVGEQAPGFCEGTVKSSIFLGETWEVTIEACDVTLRALISRREWRTAPGPGERVYFAIDPRSVFVFRGELER